MALRLLARGFYGMHAGGKVREGVRNQAQEEANDLDIRLIMSDLVDGHRIKQGLNASDAVTIIVHLDEHQMLQADLIKYGSEVFPGEQQDQYYTRSRQFVEEALLPFTGTSLPNVRIFPLLTATVSFPN